MAKMTVRRYLSGAVRLLDLGVRLGLAFLSRAIGMLAVGAQADPANDELNSSIRGGVLNYRTGKLDDGTDPYGWYQRD